MAKQSTRGRMNRLESSESYISGVRTSSCSAVLSRPELLRLLQLLHLHPQDPSVEMRIEYDSAGEIRQITLAGMTGDDWQWSWTA